MPNSAPAARPSGTPKGEATSQHLYNNAAWRKRRRAQWTRSPMCAECGILTNLHSPRGKPDPRGMRADHIVPHEGNERLFYDDANLQTLCAACHGAKSRAERV